MSKSCNAGALITPVYFKRIVRETDSEGFSVETEVNVFGENVPMMCNWVNAHGTETWRTMQLELREPATITTRFSPLINDPTLIVYKANDPKPYEVISIDNVGERGAWLEIKVQRKEQAR